jgi:hypothetical protein
MSKKQPLVQSSFENERPSLAKPPVDDSKRLRATVADLHTLVRRRLPEPLLEQVEEAAKATSEERDPVAMLLWLKHAFEALLEAASQEQPLESYESMLQKLEGDIRQHIRVPC